MKNTRVTLSLILGIILFLVLLPGIASALSLNPDEKQMLELVNGQRISHNLPSLGIDSVMTELAREHSQEMVSLNYFDHESPISGGLFERIQAKDLEGWKTAGENLAGAPTAKLAIKALMNSPSHRKNILNPEFTHVGVGVAYGGLYEKIFTQEFVGKEEASLLSHYKVVPRRREVKISFELLAPAYVNIGVYDSRGERVASVMKKEFMGDGPFETHWRGKIKSYDGKNVGKFEYRVLAQSSLGSSSASIVEKAGPEQIEIEKKSFSFLSFLENLLSKLF